MNFGKKQKIFFSLDPFICCVAHPTNESLADRRVHPKAILSNTSTIYAHIFSLYQFKKLISTSPAIDFFFFLSLSHIFFLLFLIWVLFRGFYI